MLFLADLTQATIESARVRPEQELVGVHEGKPVPVKNNLGFTAIRPAGLKAYPAIWVQDFTMAYSSGFVSVDEGLAHLRLIASRQNSKERRLPSGAIIPAHAIPDHINLDGSPVFYPGTYSSGPDQGGEPWGVCPPLNNCFDFIWLAHLLWKDADDATFFREIIKGQTLLERLDVGLQRAPSQSEDGHRLHHGGTPGRGLHLHRPDLHDRPDAHGQPGTPSGRSPIGRDSRRLGQNGIGAAIRTRRRIDPRERREGLCQRTDRLRLASRRHGRLGPGQRLGHALRIAPGHSCRRPCESRRSTKCCKTWTVDKFFAKALCGMCRSIATPRRPRPGKRQSPPTTDIKTARSGTRPSAG